jgi:indole-3-glycerol phosphate synthase
MFLQKIVESKLEEIKQKKEIFSLESIKELALKFDYQPKDLNYRQDNSLSLIAEVKRKSPSKGIIRSDFNEVEIAKSFQNNSASMISVLTDEEFFGGGLDYIQNIKTEVELPLLRKDFIIDEYQIYESKLVKADLMLLIVRILDQEKLERLASLALDLGINVLIEHHDKEEIELTKKVLVKLEEEKGGDVKNKVILGINNRNLVTFDLDFETCINLKNDFPAGYKAVAESGVFEASQLERLNKVGFDYVLIGEGLAKNPELLEWFG